MHPYLALQELQPPDFRKHRNFCTWFKNQFGDDIEEQPIIFFTDKAWFHWTSHVNSQNYRIWSANNPHAFQQTILHPQKVSIWCVSQNIVIDPIFHKQNVNGEECQCILTKFVMLLNNTREEQKGWFQLDNAKVLTSD